MSVGLRAPTQAADVGSAGPAEVDADDYRRRVLELHRLAEDLDRLTADGRFVLDPAAADPWLRHHLADAAEILTAIRTTVPGGGRTPA